MGNLLTRAVILSIVVLAGTGILRAQDDPRIGTWALNVAKSKYNPGPPPKKEIRTYAAAGHDMNVSVESTDVNGNLVTLRYTATEDGKDHPLTGSSAGNGISMHRIDARTFEADTKKDGKLIGTTMGEVSQDGKTLTLTFKSLSPAGQAITNVAVYEKQ